MYSEVQVKETRNKWSSRQKASPRKHYNNNVQEKYTITNEYIQLVNEINLKAGTHT